MIDSASPSEESSGGAQRLYCHCAYAKVIPEDVKTEVLRKLSGSERSFDTVPDLCEMSARRDPALTRLAAAKDLRIAACFPRAVKWLFHQAGVALDEERIRVINMREMDADQVVESMMADQVPEEDRS